MRIEIIITRDESKTLLLTLFDFFFFKPDYLMQEDKFHNFILSLMRGNIHGMRGEFQSRIMLEKSGLLPTPKIYFPLRVITSSALVIVALLEKKKFR